MSLRNIFTYSKQLSASLNAGLPIDRVLETLSRTAPTRQLRAASREINRSIAAGTTLTQALQQHGRLFPDFFTKMVQVGENTGRLEEVAASLSSYYEQMYGISRAVRAELYPIVAYFGILMVLVLFIQWLMGGTEALMGYLDGLAWILIAGMAVCGAYYFSGGFRDAVGTALFHAPLIQRLVRKFSLSKFCEGMRLASEAGLDIGSAIRLSSETCGNAAFRRRALRAREHIEKGDPISESLDKTGVFPFEAMQMFIVGEETGKLHEAMGHVSKLTREQAVQSLRLTLVLGIRALYVIMLIYMAFVVISFYSKLYQGILGQ